MQVSLPHGGCSRLYGAHCCPGGLQQGLPLGRQPGRQLLLACSLHYMMLRLCSLFWLCNWRLASLSLSALGNVASRLQGCRQRSLMHISCMTCSCYSGFMRFSRVQRHKCACILGQQRPHTHLEMTSKMSTAWWLTSALPDSVTIVGTQMLFLLQTLCTAHTMPLA